MSKKTILAAPLFLISPLISFLISLKDVRSKTNMFVYIAFSMFFGYAVSFTNTSADSYRYALAFKYLDTTLTLDSIRQLYLVGELRDVYRMFLFYFVKIFSINPKVMFAFAGLIYGFLSYKSLTIFIKNKGISYDKYTIILATIFFTFISISNINGFRFNTGALLLFLSLYQVFIENNNKWIFGILATSLFHYGFIPAIPVFIIFKLIHSRLYNSKKIKNILIYLFVISFAASFVLKTNFINLKFLTEVELIEGTEAAYRLNYINSEETSKLIESRSNNSIFLRTQKLFLLLIKTYIFFSCLKIIKILKKLKGDFKKKHLQLLSFVLLFLSFSFVIESFPSGGRFMNIAYLFYFIYLVRLYSILKTRLVKRIILFALPAFIFEILFTNIMLPILILSPTFWYGTFFGALIEGLTFQF